MLIKIFFCNSKKKLDTTFCFFFLKKNYFPSNTWTSLAPWDLASERRPLVANQRAAPARKGWCPRGWVPLSCETWSPRGPLGVSSRFCPGGWAIQRKSKRDMWTWWAATFLLLPAPHILFPVDHLIYLTAVHLFVNELSTCCVPGPVPSTGDRCLLP